MPARMNRTPVTTRTTRSTWVSRLNTRPTWFDAKAMMKAKTPEKVDQILEGLD